MGDLGAATTDALSGLDSTLVGLVTQLDAAVNGLAEGWISGAIGQGLDPLLNAAWH